MDKQKRNLKENPVPAVKLLDMTDLDPKVNKDRIAGREFLEAEIRKIQRVSKQGGM